MGRYRRKPTYIEAFQFDGSNFAELRAFCNVRIANGHEIQIFNPIGTYLIPTELNKGATAELWVEANHQWLPIVVGEWVLKDELGCYPCRDEQFRKVYEEVANGSIADVHPERDPAHDGPAPLIDGSNAAE